MDIIKKLQDEFNIKPSQVENTVKLIDEGNTIPFIARYRKELTGSLDDQLLRELYERLIYLRNLDDRREQVLRIIEEQGNLTDEISSNLENAQTMAEIEDIYRPYKPKRRTKATIAKEKGLEPLANIIWEQTIESSIEELAKEYINENKEVNSVDDAINGACDIIAENISDDADYRKIVRNESLKSGKIISKATDENEKVYMRCIMILASL